ncbi:MAG: ComEC/Rec2 family competence protein [Oscillospiraceae bacterium]
MMAMFGFSASVVRSGIMLMITQSAPLFCRRTDVLNSLCAALLLMTVLTPFAAADPALLMSALGVFGAAVAGPALNSIRRFGWERFAAAAKLKKPPRYRSGDGVRAPGQRSVLEASPRGIPAVALTPFFSAGLPLGVVYAVSGIPGLISASGSYELLSGILGFFGSRWCVASM